MNRLKIKNKWFLCAVFVISWITAGKATTVVLAVTEAGIVIASDSNGVGVANNYTPAIGSAVPSTKLAIIQNRIIVANIGLSRAATPSGDKVRYDFQQWIVAISNTLPLNISVPDLATIIQSKSSETFAGFEQGVIKTHAMHSADPSEMCAPLVNYIIAGYENGKPVVYSVHMDIDWMKETVVGPTKSLFHPRDTGEFYFVTLGHNSAANNYSNPDSYAYKQAMRRIPALFKQALARQSGTLSDTAQFSSFLVAVEEEVEPDVVGGDIQVATLPANGTASATTVDRDTLRTTNGAKKKNNNGKQSPKSTAH